MNRLHRNVEYALIALNHLAKNNSGYLLSAKDLSQHMNAPFDPLSRVMQKLAKCKLIQSEQGPTGGYRLICNFGEVSLYDLIKILQGPLELVKCLSSDLNCDLSNQCELKSPVSYLNEKLIDFYRKMSLAELFENSQSEIERTGSVVL